MRYALLDPIFKELAKDGKIRINGDIITLSAGHCILMQPLSQDKIKSVI